MEKPEYENFEDFILDESFHEYVRGYPHASVEFWDWWISSNPGKSAEVARAKNMLNTLLQPRKAAVPVDKDDSLQFLLDRIKHEKEKARHRGIIVPAWLKVAAVLVLTIGLAWIFNLLYSSFQNQHPGNVAYNEVIVPIGEKSQVVLSDGTHVWINAGSHFKYPAHFDAHSRNVYLTGEAFFDVIHNTAKPFSVFTRDSQIKVLGTAFNVKAYPDDAKTQTTVVRGLVSVQNTLHKTPAVLIRPNQAAVIDEEAKASTTPADKGLKVIDHVNVEAATSWKDQALVFEDEQLGDMVKKMERWFNVKIEITDESLKKERYNGKFVNNETVYQVLEAIKLTTPIKYKTESNEIIISRR